MKKILISLLATFAMTTAHADEGMWTLYNLPTAIYEQMKQEGARRFPAAYGATVPVG